MKTLATIIVYGTAIGSLLIPKFANAQTITKHYFNSDKIETLSKESAVEKEFINPFIQANDSTLNWYGSGDINNDNKIDSHDADRLDSLINKTFQDTTDKRLYDRADINGDEKITIADKQTLDDYLNKKIQYLPSNWNKLKTRQERLDWLKKMISIDKTDTLEGIEGKWVSGNFSIQTHINFQGYNKYIDSKYDTTNNCRFNIPLYYAGARRPWHGITAILTGDNPLNWNDWHINEPQNDKPVVIGEWNLKKDSSEVWIGKINRFVSGGYGSQDFIRFSIKDSIPSLLSYDTNYVKLERDIDTFVEEIKHKNVVVKDFHLKQNYPNPFNPTTTITYELPKNEKVLLEVYNILGQKLETLVNGNQPQGIHEIKFNASKYSSGIYLYRIQTKDFVETKKMMFVK